MWDATNSGSFSVTYADGTFSASGAFDSSGNFGEMGTERNGFFVNHPEEVDRAASVGPPAQSLSLPMIATPVNQTPARANTKQSVKSVLLKRRVPVKLIH
jgi:hypothetical protein